MWIGRLVSNGRGRKQYKPSLKFSTVTGVHDIQDSLAIFLFFNGNLNIIAFSEKK